MSAVSFQIRHVSSYYYDNWVTESRNLIKMYPIEDAFQKVLSHSITVSGNVPVKPGKDIFGNKFGSFIRKEPHVHLEVVSEIRVQNTPRDVLSNASVAQSWEDILLLGLDSSFRLFLNPKNFLVMPSVWEVVKGFAVWKMTPLDTILTFNEYVYDNFLYSPNTTVVNTPMDQVWYMRAGVCQDFAHVLIYMLRSVNIPTRYVSGYICPNQDGLRGDGATHAWVEAYLPDYGWIGIDPTNNCVVAEKYVRVAVGRNYFDVAPLVGEFTGNSRQSLEVIVTAEYVNQQGTSS